MSFTWDPRKAASNLRKHSVSFAEASTVFDDEHALVQSDVVHEGRFVILGMSARAKVLFVVYAERDAGEVIRIISARRATSHERKTYETQ